MITADFFKNSDNKLLGFAVSGHSGFEDVGKDIVCAAVSSAVMLVSNAITESFGIDAKVKSEGGTVCLKLNGESGEADKLLLSLLNHLYVLQSDYPDFVRVKLHDR